MSAVCLSYRSVTSVHSQEFYLDYNRDKINANPDDITSNKLNLILPIFAVP